MRHPVYLLWISIKLLHSYFFQRNLFIVAGIPINFKLHGRARKSRSACNWVKFRQSIRKAQYVFALPFFLIKIVSVLLEHTDSRTGVDFFPSRRVQTTYRSLSTHRYALTWMGRPALSSVTESTPENCSILEATQAFHGRTNDARPCSSLHSIRSIARQRRLNRRSRDETSVFLHTCLANDFVS